MSRMYGVVGWTFPNRVTSTALSRTWGPHSMARVDNKETPYSTVSKAESANEEVATPPDMT